MTDKQKKIQDLASKYLTSLNDRSVYFDADQFGELSDFFYEQGKVDIAFSCIEDGLNIHPFSENLKIKQIKYLSIEGNYDQALHEIKKLDSISNDYDFELYFAKLQCFLAKNDIDEVDIITQKILEEEKGQLDNVLIDVALLYMEHDEYDKALILFKKLKNISSFKEELPDIAFCYEMNGEYREAISLYQELLKIDSYSAISWFNIGRLYALLEDYAQAVDALEYSIVIEKNPDIMFLKAGCLMILDRLDEAMVIYHELLILQPDNSEIYLKLSDCNTRLFRFVDAHDYLERYRLSENEDEEYYLRKIELLQTEDRSEEAQSMLSEGLARLDNSLQLAFCRVDSLLSSNKLEEAYSFLIEIYEKEEEPDEEEELLDYLSYLAIQLNKFDQGVNFTTKVLLLNPQNTKCKFRLAFYLMESNDFSVLEPYLDMFSNEELVELVSGYFKILEEDKNKRSVLIIAIKNIIENRILYKALKY